MSIRPCRNSTRCRRGESRHTCNSHRSAGRPHVWCTTKTLTAFKEDIMTTAIADIATVNHSSVNQAPMNHPVVSRQQWLADRKALQAREKELTRLGDQIARERRALPWVRMDKDYVFDTPQGPRSLADLFDRFRQRMGWRFPWVSSHGTDFNRDFHVSFTADELEKGEADYNFGNKPPGQEMPDVSAFWKDDA